MTRPSRGDPYERYLAMCRAEDDPVRSVRRSEHRRYRYGAHLPPSAWVKVYWRLANRRDARGRYTARDLGDASTSHWWWDAVTDCLKRRDLANAASWDVLERRKSSVEVGDLVRHCNTGQWGRVVQVAEEQDGVAEVEVERQGDQPTHGRGRWSTRRLSEVVKNK